MDKTSLEYARSLDEQEPLGHFRSQFIFPTITSLKSTTDSPSPLQSSTPSSSTDDEPCTYLCGNSLGLQPTCVSTYVQAQLRRWATKGVFGHFKPVSGSPIPPWLHLDDTSQKTMAAIVGAQPSEVCMMQTLTANLHLLMASFYRPTEKRFKIIMESKAFPSDHYVVETQITHHNLDPKNAMILLQAPAASKSSFLPTDHILSVIDQHADSTALLLLPGIQFYTGQLFDMQRITEHAQARGIVVGWDLAHAVGNVPLSLHDWNVDFAAWCTYKYMNAGPGAMGGLFVHDRHTTPNPSAPNGHRPRLAGWWGSDKATRFDMANRFAPIPGAAGFQLSNPSALDFAAVLATLSVFAQTDMLQLRQRSLRLTAHLESLLALYPQGHPPYTIITPRDPAARGAQLSILLAPGLLDHVMAALEDAGVVVDERKPDVVRVAPAPLYNNFADVWRFVNVFQRAVGEAVVARDRVAAPNGSVMHEGGQGERGWAAIK